jgi:low temperature requirement protein LtrA
MAASTMRNGLTVRIAVWAIAGFLVTISWGIYFATSNKDVPVEPMVYMIARLSQPGVGAVTLLYPHVFLGLSLNLIANAATYALVGLVLEVTRKRLNHTE